MSLVEELDARSVGFRGLDRQIDTATASGRLQIHLFAALAEFERELRHRRSTGRRGPTIPFDVPIAAPTRL